MHRVQQRQRNIYVADYKRELAKAQLGDNVANHMTYIYLNILYDKFDLTFKQLTNFIKRVYARRVAWQDDDNKEVTNESLLMYCVNRKIDVVKFVKEIPMSQKLYLADLRKNRAIPGAEINIESALRSTLFLVIPSLKETYRFSNEKIEEFMKWVAFFIESYYKKQPGCKDHYLNDEMIRQMFIEDEHWDIVEGKAVTEDEL